MLFARRKFLTRGMQLLGAALLPSGLLADLLQGGPTAAGAPQADELIWYSSRYLTAEMPMDRLNSWITPTKHFFVRNNLLMPDVDLDRWRADLRHSPEMRCHAAGFAANETDEIRAIHHAVRTLTRIGAAHADRSSFLLWFCGFTAMPSKPPLMGHVGALGRHLHRLSKLVRNVARRSAV